MVIDAGPLTLRPWGPADVAFVFDACQDPEIARWTTLPHPFTARDAVEVVTTTGDGTHRFAVVLTDTGELLGSVLVRAADDPPGEISYWMAREARGKGHAADALTAVARWALTSLGLDAVWLRVARGNVASVRVAEKAGFTLAEVVVSGCHDGERPDDALVYRRSSSAGRAGVRPT